jgi:hypothetical protein
MIFRDDRLGVAWGLVVLSGGTDWDVLDLFFGGFVERDKVGRRFTRADAVECWYGSLTLLFTVLLLWDTGGRLVVVVTVAVFVMGGALKVESNACCSSSSKAVRSSIGRLSNSSSLFSSDLDERVGMVVFSGMLLLMSLLVLVLVLLPLLIVILPTVGVGVTEDAIFW